NALKKMGGELKAFYMTQGQFDGVLIFEVPSEDALTRFLLTNAAAGNIRTETLRAFTEEEDCKHISAAGWASYLLCNGDLIGCLASILAASCLVKSPCLTAFSAADAAVSTTITSTGGARLSRGRIRCCPAREGSRDRSSVLLAERC